MANSVHTVKVSDMGFHIDSHALGKAPLVGNLQKALGTANRVLERRLGTRLWYVYDDLGISFLSQADSKVVYTIVLTVEKPNWRATGETDPLELFKGHFVLGAETLNPPINRAAVDLLQRIAFKDIDFRFVTHGETVAEIGIDFPLNEVDEVGLSRKKGGG